MNLLEKDIEDIIYNSPWLLDERYVIPRIKGSRDEYGRQINIGRNGLNRYIDLVFRDSRDDRPVIIELKKNSLNRENIAQILEYRALIVSMDEENKIEWQNEFKQNFYCPKLMLIGTTASEEVKISANLAGVEIRTLVGIEVLEVDFNEINDINDKLNNWNTFLNTGNRPLEDRDEWIEEIYDWTKQVVQEYRSNEVSTMKKLYKTSPKNAWVENIPFPFINNSFYYKDRCLCGLYEYCGKEIKFSNEYIYFDFLVQSIYYENYEDDKELEEIENRANEILEEKGYQIVSYEDGVSTIKILRSALNNYEDFKDTLIPLIQDAIYINDQIVDIFGDFDE